MSVSEVVTQSHFYPLVSFTRYADTIEKHVRYGPKGYKAYRYIVSSGIIDHDDEIVDIHGLAEVLPIMEKQGSRIQGLHSNYPAGKFFDWGFCKIKDENGDKLSIWIDIEFFDDYPSQKKLLQKIELPSGHPERMNGLSLGGKSLEKKRMCDQNRCWTHIVKLEGWEISIVKEGANRYARQIQEDTNTIEGLNLPVEYLNKMKKPLEEKKLTTLNRDPKGKFSKDGNPPPKKEEGSNETDCVDCPKCPECQGSMKDGKCEKCGYSKGNNPEEGKPTGESDGSYPEEGKMGDHSNTDDKMSEDNMNSDGYSEDDNMAPDNTQAIEQKIDTLMEALNIGKEERNKLTKALDGLAQVVTKLAGEQPPKEVIEKDGVKYQLIKEEPSEELNDNEKLLLKTMSEMSQEMALLKNQYGIIPNAGDAMISNPIAEDDEISKDEGIDVEAFFKSNTEKTIEHSGLSYDEIDFQNRQDLSFSKQMTLDDLGLYIN